MIAASGETARDSEEPDFYLQHCYSLQGELVRQSRATLIRFREVQAPPHLSKLTDETRTRLAAVVDVNIESHCRPMYVAPQDSPECRAAWSAHTTAALALVSALGKWAEEP